MGFVKFVENKSIHNQPIFKVKDEGQEVVVIHMEASGTKRDKLWRLQKWPWNVRGFERETLMLNDEDLLHGLQSWCFGIMLRYRFFWVSYKRGESSFPNIFIKVPIGRFYFLG